MVIDYFYWNVRKNPADTLHILSIRFCLKQIINLLLVLEIEMLQVVLVQVILTLSL